MLEERTAGCHYKVLIKNVLTKTWELIFQALLSVSNSVSRLLSSREKTKDISYNCPHNLLITGQGSATNASVSMVLLFFNNSQSSSMFYTGQSSRQSFIPSFFLHCWNLIGLPTGTSPAVSYSTICLFLKCTSTILGLFAELSQPTTVPSTAALKPDLLQLQLVNRPKYNHSSPSSVAFLQTN